MPNKHAVSRYMASSISDTGAGEDCVSRKSGTARYFWSKGSLLMLSRNQGSARKSPVCSTAPWPPSTRYLHVYQHVNTFDAWGTHITAPGQWLASNAVMVTLLLFDNWNGVGILKAISCCGEELTMFKTTITQGANGGTQIVADLGVMRSS